MNKPAHQLSCEKDGASGYVLNKQVGFLLRRAHQHASAIFQNVFESESLTPQQFAVLAKLYEVGEVTQNKLGRLVDTDPASMQGIIQRLQLRRLIQRHQDPLHRRRLKVCLTDQGRDRVQCCFALGERVSELTLQALNESDRRELLRLLQAITAV